MERSTAYGEERERTLDRLLAALRRRQLERHLRPGATLVDLGCGYHGRLLHRLAPRLREGIGIDVSVARDPPAPNVRLVAGRADAALPLPDESVDVVSCLAVLEHVEAPQVLLAETHRILRPGGALVLTTPSRLAQPVLERVLAPLRLIDPEEIHDHLRYYSRTRLRNELERAGFPAPAIDVRAFELGLNLAAVARRA